MCTGLLFQQDLPVLICVVASRVASSVDGAFAALSLISGLVLCRMERENTEKKTKRNVLGSMRLCDTLCVLQLGHTHLCPVLQER